MSDDRLDALLVAQATEGLDATDAAELDALLDASPDADADAYADVAAAITLAELGTVEPMPAHLRQAVLDDVPPRVAVAPANAAPPVRAGWMGWAVAIAVAAVLAMVLLQPERPAPIIATAAPTVVVVPAVEPAPREPTPAEARKSLLNTRADARVLAWTAGPDPTGTNVRGDVVWSASEQRGYMRFEGLRPLQPEDAVYQLWIFDGTRDDRYPVDGGVFTVPTGARDVVVPIDATLPVAEAAMFAVTVEAPGGVVVSDRSRIAALAK
ncbi:MAG: anti-sigma factor [Myxococcota bacterium]